MKLRRHSKGLPPYMAEGCRARADEVDVADEEAIFVRYACVYQLADLALHEGDRVHHALWTDHIDLAWSE